METKKLESEKKQYSMNINILGQNLENQQFLNQIIFAPFSLQKQNYRNYLLLNSKLILCKRI